MNKTVHYTAAFIITAAFLIAIMALPVSADTREATDRPVRLHAHAEAGFLSVLSHKIKYAGWERYFDYRANGGQNVLFFNARLSLDLVLNDRHTVVLLYQPLELETTVRLYRDTVIHGVTFPAGSGLKVLYRFPFYRMSYMYDLFPGRRHELSLGFSMQIRNATIGFESTDGSLALNYRNVGPVPLLKVRGRYGFQSGFWVGLELDGMYAPVSYINGSDNETVGAILDASIRGGYTFSENAEVFLNLRYIGGGASNTDPLDYTKNWLHFMSLTVGATLMI